MVTVVRLAGSEGDYLDDLFAVILSIELVSNYD